MKVLLLIFCILILVRFLTQSLTLDFLSKLEGFGVKGKVLDVTKDFLTDRTMRVCVEGQWSEPRGETRVIWCSFHIAMCLRVLRLRVLRDALVPVVVLRDALVPVVARYCKREGYG